jgi:hypothetical protein
MDECLRTLEFMYQYVDRVMQTRVPSLRYVVLNVYGGEALNHPDIVPILNKARELHSQYKDRWHLTITTTTNAIVSPRKFEQIVELVDEFTVSWHTYNTPDQKQRFRENVLHVKKAGRRVKCVVLMNPELFDDAQSQIKWCVENDIKHLPRQLDHDLKYEQYNYNQEQVIWFERLYNKKLIPIQDSRGQSDLSATGRACCGGRSLCADQNYKEHQKFVSNRFPDWYCSVDHFFLYVKQVTGEVFVNKDCKMNYEQQVGPIGLLTDTDAMLNQIGNTPIIRCGKTQCMCGLCAPKAEDLTTYNKLMRKYEISNNHLL